MAQAVKAAFLKCEQRVQQKCDEFYALLRDASENVERTSPVRDVVSIPLNSKAAAAGAQL